jgi:hypothetical protein
VNVCGTNGRTVSLPIRRTFSEREGHDFTGHLQSLNAGFCRGRPGTAHFRRAHRPFCRRNSDHRLLIFGAFVSIDLGIADRATGKKAKVLSLANCGMGAAVDIGVIREHVLGFLSVSLRGGYDVGRRIYFDAGAQALLVWRAAAEASDDLLANFALGGGSREVPAQQIG